ncbi:hypothetical protein BLNAU_5859 [Blattamonas nauphoetae]|uniref:Uncharacterized protein n=1 Tax=Blattamonas nauphoetae TaxID=2049346 RepID=A0ABQ9Y5X3_9EUKA|nr:hypothetical protein BLNAU_5859 [Blattamonas nauphoetae]
MIIEEYIRIILLLSVPSLPPPPFAQSQSLQHPFPSSISSNNVVFSIVSSYFGVNLPAFVLYTTMHLLAVLLIVAPRHVLLIDSSSFLASVPTAFELRSLSVTTLLAPSLPKETSNYPCINTPLEWLLPLSQEHFNSDPIQDILKTERELYVFSLPTKNIAFITALSASFAISATPDKFQSFSASALCKEDKVKDCDLAVWRKHFSVVADHKEQIKIASAIFTTLSPKETFQHLVEKNIFQLDFDELPPPILHSLPDASPVK